MVTPPAIRWRHACICCALPQRLVHHLADGSDDEDDRKALHAQASHTAKLRGQRAGTDARKVEPKRSERLLHRQVFNAGGGTLLPGQLLRDEDDPPTADKAADQAYENVGVAMRFFREVLGRESADGRGMRIDTSVHYGLRFSNAMWTGEQMIVGDGDGKQVRGLAHDLGLIAHEFCHAVVQSIVRGGLGVVRQAGQPPALKGEAGALNESFADVFASMVKQWHGGQTVEQADWLMGEDVLAPRAGKAVRSLKDPGNRSLTWPKDDQLKDYRKVRVTDEAHKASGVANHAFYLAAMDLGGHAWEQLAKPWFRGYDKLYPQATYLDAAHATVAAAAAIHGKGSKPHKAVKDAWHAVHVLA